MSGREAVEFGIPTASGPIYAVSTGHVKDGALMFMRCILAIMSLAAGSTISEASAGKNSGCAISCMLHKCSHSVPDQTPESNSIVHSTKFLTEWEVAWAFSEEFPHRRKGTKWMTLTAGRWTGRWALKRKEPFGETHGTRCCWQQVVTGILIYRREPPNHGLFTVRTAACCVVLRSSVSYTCVQTACTISGAFRITRLLLDLQTKPYD